MKTLILVLSLITISVITKAQTEPGTIYVGGGVNYSDTKSENSALNYAVTYNTHQVTLEPTIGMFINSHWAIGITPVYTYTENTTMQTPGGVNTTNASYLGGGIEFRYYVPLGEKFAFFPKLLGTYSASVGNTSIQSGHNLITMLSPNFAFFPTHKIAVSFAFGSIGWIKETETTKPQNGNLSTYTNNNNFVVNGNNFAGLSVAYHFTKK